MFCFLATGQWITAPDQGSNPHPVLGGEVLVHWTAREVPDSVKFQFIFYLEDNVHF